MLPSHKINNAIFDLRFTSRTGLLRENYYLGGFVKQSLVPVVDAVLSEHDRDGSIICIDKLIIDLGRFHISDFKSRMPPRLRAELDAILSAKIRHLQSSSDSRERMIPAARRDLELVSQFLLTGALPGPQNLKHHWHPGRGLQQILDNEQTAFLRFLRTNSHRTQVCRRLVRQFPEAAVRQVARLLAAAQFETVFKIVDHILGRYRDRSPTGAQNAAFTALVWEHLLEYFIQNPNSPFTALRFMNWIAGKLEQRQDSMPEELTAILAEETGKQVRRKHLASQPGRPHRTIVSGSASRKIIEGYDLYQALHFYLKHGMMPWAADTVSPIVAAATIIEKLKKGHPEKLFRLTNDLQHDEDLCRRLGEHLAPPVIKQLITAILTVSSPGNSNDRLTFIQSIEDFADRAADPKLYYVAILRNLVAREPVDLKQLAARTHDPLKAAPRYVALETGLDPDMIRAYLTAMLKTGSKAGAPAPSFSRLLGVLEEKYSREYRDYLAWLAANKKRFTSFLRLAGPQKLKKMLARLAGFPAAERCIELLEKVFGTEVPSTSSNQAATLRALSRLMIAAPFSDAEVFLQSAVVRLAGLANLSASEGRAIEALEDLLAKTEEAADKKIYRRLKSLLEAYRRNGNLVFAAPKTPEKGPSKDKPTANDETALFKYLTGETMTPPITDVVARSIFRRMIRHRSDTLYASLHDHLKDNFVIKRMITLLPENWLTRVLAGLRPDLHLPVQTYADIIADACCSEEVIERPDEIRKLKWEFIFTYLVLIKNRPFDESDFIRRFIGFLAGGANKSEPAAITAILVRNLGAHTHNQNGDVKLAARQLLKLLEVDAPRFRRPAARPTFLDSESADSGFNESGSTESFQQTFGPGLPKPARSEGLEEKKIDADATRYALEAEPTEILRIEHPAGLREAGQDMLEETVMHNAGMVIAAPYLPQLWNMLDLTEGGKFKDLQAAERAVHLLQFMTDERVETPEYQLVLNKILCGVKTGTPIVLGIDITDNERRTIETLIQSMIANWKTVGNTSVNGFRESFLQRRGKLVLKDEAWHLKVEQRAFDMLLDSIPWGFSTIKHPWMERVVYVKWR